MDFDARLLEHVELFIGIEVVGLVFLALTIGETILDFATGRRPSLRESLANALIYIGNLLLDRTLIGASFVIGLLVAEGFAVAEIPLTWTTWCLAVLAADFTYYWMHRAEHEIRLLWAVHNTHHSSPEYNLTTSFRLSWVESLHEWVFFVPMVLLGFDVVQVLGALLVVVVYQTWIHTEKVGRLGWMDKVFNTPSVHRVHHASNPQYLDKNYGGVLIVWDRLFGTYAPEEAPVTYGITMPIGSHNPLVINFKEYAMLFRDIRRATGWRAALGFAFHAPGWSPETLASDLSPKANAAAVEPLDAQR